MMRTGEKFSIGDISELLRKRAGELLSDIKELLREGTVKALGATAVAMLVASGCAAPTSEAKPDNTEQGQEDVQTGSEGNPDLDWRLVDWGCEQDCERGEPGIISKACDGTALIYINLNRRGRGGITAIPNSPECGYTSPASENGPVPTAEVTPAPANGE